MLSVLMLEREKREKLFFELHCLLYAFLEIIYSCVDCLVSFHHKYHIFCAAKYVILKINCNSNGLLKEYLSQ